jgi:hypothetical protein
VDRKNRSVAAFTIVVNEKTTYSEVPQLDHWLPSYRGKWLTSAQAFERAQQEGEIYCNVAFYPGDYMPNEGSSTIDVHKGLDMAGELFQVC